MSVQNTARVARFGPQEIILRDRLNRLSLLVSSVRQNVASGTLAMTVVKITYPAIIDRIGALDRNRDRAKRFHGQMTQSALEENEGEARLLNLWVDCCSAVLKSNGGPRV